MAKIFPFPEAVTELITGVTPDEVRAASNWHLKVASNLKVTDAPTSKELSVLASWNNKQRGRMTP